MDRILIHRLFFQPIQRKKAIKASYPFRNNVFIAYVLSGFLVFYYTGITKGFPSTLEMVSSTS